MPPITRVFVTVPEADPDHPRPVDRVVPVPPSEGSTAGGMLLMCVPGKVYAVSWSTFTRKRITGGDFVLCDINGKPAPSPEHARAGDNVKLEPDGSVSQDQRTDDEINATAAIAAAKAKASAPAAAAPKSFDTSDTSKGKA